MSDVFDDPAIQWMMSDIGIKPSKDTKEFMDRVAAIESSGNPKASSKVSSARGKYQWLNGDKPDGTKGLNVFQEDIAAAKRYYQKSKNDVPKWLKDAEKHNDPRKLSESEQDKLFLFRMYRLGKNSDLARAYSGDRNTQRMLYMQLHHTAPDDATRERVDLFLPAEAKPGMLTGGYP